MGIHSNEKNEPTWIANLLKKMDGQNSDDASVENHIITQKFYVHFIA